MGEGISRRDFAAIAGGTIVLSACGQSTTTGSATDTSNGAAKAELGALTKSDENFGANLFGDSCVSPTGSKDPFDGAPNGWEPFAPEYIHLIHIECPDPWRFRVNQAHFKVKAGATDDASRLAHCVEILEERLDLVKTKPEARFYDLTKNKPVRKKDGEWADYPNADNFIYGSQHQIFIFIQGGALTFNPKKLVSFSSQRRGGGVGQANHAFFKATLLDKEAPQDDMNIGRILAEQGRIIRINNHFSKPNGRKLSGTEKIDYSMNFHYGQPTIGGQTVAMIFDPNTGNGAGNEP